MMSIKTVKINRGPLRFRAGFRPAMQGNAVTNREIAAKSGNCPIRPAVRRASVVARPVSSEKSPAK